MTLEACTNLVRSQDPDRFGAALVANAQDRPALITLYALNLEIARAPFQSGEPLLAEMRLQWWVDRLAEMGTGRPPPLHDVLTPLWEAWGSAAGDLTPLAEARRRDCFREPFATPEEVAEYVADTSGRLMARAVARLGADAQGQAVAADQGLGAGLVAWLRALPQLQPLGLGLAGGDPADAARLARMARDAFQRAAGSRGLLPKRAAAALYSGPGVGRLLSGILENKVNILEEEVVITPFQRRASLARLALTGRWWR